MMHDTYDINKILMNSSLTEMQVERVHVVRNVTHRWPLLHDSHFLTSSDKMPTLNSGKLRK